jgi:cellulose synthase operon protein YhjQ
MLRTEVRVVTDTPKDIATLYSRAHVEATRYWDFSASRQQVRGKFRARIVREPAREFQPPQLQPPQVEPPQVEPPQVEPPQVEPPEVEPPEVEPPEVEPPQVEPSPLALEPPVKPITQAEPEEGVATRWYALHSVFAPAEAAQPPLSPEAHPPIIALFSLAGGVGKTCMVATLGRALAALGERLLLADTSAGGMLPFYFGSRESRPGAVRTFFPPGPTLGVETDAPVQVLNLPPERYPGPDPDRDPWLTDLLNGGRLANRILVDVATASQEVTGRLQRLRPTVLVPVLPDMSSVVSLGPLEALPESGETLYLLNQFDAGSPLHLDVRALLQQQLGDRLLPFVVRRSYAVSEALAEGMTVIDYAPDSPVAEDYRVLASWLRSFAAAAEVGTRGVRWTER